MHRDKTIKFFIWITAITVLSGFYYEHENRVYKSEMTGSWIMGQNMPSADGYGSAQSSAGYTRNDTGWVYAIGGAGNLTTVYAYNVITNTWSTAAPLPSGRDRLGSAILKDSIYCVAGANTQSTGSNTLFKYDVYTNQWTSRANLPASIYWTGSTGYQDSLIYCAGGLTTAAQNTVFVYNAISNSWRTASPLPLARYGGGFSKSGDTLVYAGGNDGTNIVNTTYKGVISQADRSIITWSSGAPMPQNIWRNLACEWGNKGIIMTNGSTGTAFTGLNYCYSYSPGADAWSVLANKTTLTTAAYGGSVMLGNNIWKLICSGGFNGNNYISTTEIFSDTLAVIGIHGNSNDIPESYSLAQNYPNPFNPATTIQFDIAAQGNVKITIYDLTGKTVKVLFNEKKSAGSYEVTWDASNFASGIYFYRLESGSFSNIKKMILIK